MNITNLTLSEQYLVPSNQIYVVEELCKPYIESVGKAYLTVAIFNLFYSFTWLWLKNRKDKIIFKVDMDGKDLIFTIGNLSYILDVMFFMLNFFVVGYWLLVNNIETFLRLPFVGWFI